MNEVRGGPAGGDRLRIERRADLPELEIIERIRARPVVGRGLSIQEVVLSPGAFAPVHTHEEEQVGYLVSGSCDFTDGERTWRLSPGDFYHAPAGTPHGATALGEGCVIVDAFAPPREQIVRMLAERNATADGAN